MAVQLVNIAEKDLGRGIDARSAENMIQTGFVQDLLNADVIERRVRKRVGYQGYAGNLPVRVLSVQTLNQLEDNIVLTLEANTSFLGVNSTPLILYGKTSLPETYNGIGPANTGQYFREFKSNARKILENTPEETAPEYKEVVSQFLIKDIEHGLDSQDIFTGLTLSTSTVNTSNEVIYSGNLEIADSPKQINVEYANRTGTTLPTFTYYLKRESSPGVVYVSLPLQSGAVGTPSTFTITRETHDLQNTNLVIRAQRVDLVTGVRTMVFPDEVVISDDGDVTITLTDGEFSNSSFIFILSTTPGDNQGSIFINPGKQGVFTVDSPGEAFIFPSIYELSASGRKSQVFPESVTYDETAGQFQITIDNQSPGEVQYVVHWLFGFTRSNQISLTAPAAAVLGTSEDFNPQLTLWGLDHSKIYTPIAGDRAGWVTHLDTYKRGGLNRVVAGLGGNVFDAREREELGTAYKMGRRSPRLESVVEGTNYLGPVFYDTELSREPSRNRGAIQGSNLASGFVPVTQITYDPLVKIYSKFLVTDGTTFQFLGGQRHGLAIGRKVRFQNVGNGLSPDTDYYVVRDGFTATTFRVATSKGGDALVGIESPESGFPVILVRVEGEWIRVSSDEPRGATRYRLSISDMSLYGGFLEDGNPDSIISTNSVVPDYLTVNNTSYFRHDGTFKILKVEADVANGVLDLWVDNPGVITSDYDDVNLAGFATIQTDQIRTVEVPEFIPGDSFNTDAFPENILTVVNTLDRTYVGSWNASINSPELSNLTGNPGHIYKVSVAGTQDFTEDSEIGNDIAFAVDDWVYFSAGMWKRADASDASFAEFTQVGASDHRVLIDGIVDELQVGGSLRLPGIRKSRAIPLSDVEGIVVGDMLSYTDTERYYRVEHVYAEQSDTAVDIAADGVEAIVTLTSTTTLRLNEQMYITLIGAGPLSGVHVVSRILGDSTFVITTSVEAGNYTGTLLGNSVTIDEDLQWSASIGNVKDFKVETRWVPVEAPVDTSSLTPNTVKRYLASSDYTEQRFLRSVMVNDNMYLTNGDDAVLKYDGDRLYRAGLINWHPGIFITRDEGSQGKIPINPRSAGFKAPASESGDLNAGNLELSSRGDKGTIPVGTQVRISYGVDNPATLDKVEGPIVLPKLYTVEGYEDVSASTVDGVPTEAKVLIRLNENLTDTGINAAGTITEVAYFKYYFRLNAVDANNNVVATASTQYDDFNIELTKSAAVRLRFVNFPAWDIYDFERITLQIYRTKQNQAAPYYLVTTLKVPFESNQPYLDYVDTTQDGALTALDSVSSVLKGRELGTQWNEPLRAKYITSAGNRLVLANVKDYPELDVQFLGNSSVTSTILIDKQFSIKESTTSPAVDFQFLSESSSCDIVGIDASMVTSADLLVDTVSDSVGLDNLAAGHWIYCTRKTANDNGYRLNYSGWWRVSSVSSVNEVFGGKAVRRVTVAFPEVLLDNASVTFTAQSADIKITNPEGKHNLKVTDKVKFQTQLDVDTPHYINNLLTYYVVDVIDDRTFRIAVASPDGTFPKGATAFVANQDGTAWASLQEVTLIDSVVIPRNPSTTTLPVLIGSNDGNLGQLGGNPIEDGANTLLFTTVRRLANAINVYMRTLSSPWISARAGNDLTPAGRLILRSPKVTPEVFSVTLPEIFDFPMFINGVRYAGNSSITAETRSYPSRVLVSYQNYPEVFDAPTSILDSDSDSAIDINSADGQEITGVIPFFGDSAFGGSQKSGVLVVFKSNSIYLVDVSQKESGGTAVQRLETQGLGCTAPYSISVTKNGIMFANEAGIYCLRRDQSIEYIGRFMERNWIGRVNREALESCHGHHYGLGRQYKLSVPLRGDKAPSEVYVYNHTGEVEGGELGAWARYDNHRAIGWANLLQDALWASTDGRVFTIRRQGTVTDYRDDSAGINFELLTRPMDFGEGGVRKLLDKVTVHYRVGADNKDTILSTAINTLNEFISSQSFTVAEPGVLSGLGDAISQQITTIAHSIPRRKSVFFQIKITNSALDQNLEIAGMDYRVGGLGNRGIKQATTTNSGENS
jgi:hypothetical protein